MGSSRRTKNSLGYRRLQALLYGTLAVGILDGLDAVIFFYLRNGVRPTRIFQGIAAGLIGRESAVGGGLATAALGLLLHFFIAFMVVAVFMFASKRMPALTRAPLLFGPLYGIAVYLVMNFIVIPLSAVAGGTRAWPTVVNGILIHMFGVGLPASLAARAAYSDAPTRPSIPGSRPQVPGSGSRIPG